MVRGKTLSPMKIEFFLFPFFFFSYSCDLKNQIQILEFFFAIWVRIMIQLRGQKERKKKNTLFSPSGPVLRPLVVFLAFRESREERDEIEYPMYKNSLHI